MNEDAILEVLISIIRTENDGVICKSGVIRETDFRLREPQKFKFTTHADFRAALDFVKETYLPEPK